MWRLEHGLVHLFSVESAVPDPQLCSWKHILRNKRRQKGGIHQSFGGNKVFSGLNEAMNSRTRRRACICAGHTYLRGVEVQVIVLLISRQILVLVVGGGSYQHHPVAVFFTAGVETHHHTIPLEDLSIKG